MPGSYTPRGSGGQCRRGWPAAGPHSGRRWKFWETILIRTVDTARIGPLRVRYGDAADPRFPAPQAARWAWLTALRFASKQVSISQADTRFSRSDLPRSAPLRRFRFGARSCPVRSSVNAPRRAGRREGRAGVLARRLRGPSAVRLGVGEDKELPHHSRQGDLSAAYPEQRAPRTCA